MKATSEPRAAAPTPTAVAVEPATVAESAAAPPPEVPLAGEGVPPGATDLQSVDWNDMFQRYFSGLDAYRGELTEVNRQLDASADDADQVTECANRLQAANDNFIGVANEAIGTLDDGPLASLPREAGQTKLRQTVDGQLETATTNKSDLAQLDVASDPQAARARLKKTTEVLHESTDDLFVEVQECLASMRAEFEAPETPLVPHDPATGLVTREHAEFLIGELAKEVREQRPATVALLELDNAALIDADVSGSVDLRLLCGVSNIVRQSLTASHTAARFSDQQFLVVVPHEDVNQAARRTEEMRQRVASTEFMADGRAIKTTVTCALAELSAEQTGEKLFEFLQEALTEAKRYGGNRTFTHDGNSPSPVVPPELTVAAQQLAI